MEKYFVSVFVFVFPLHEKGVVTLILYVNWVVELAFYLDELINFCFNENLFLLLHFVHTLYEGNENAEEFFPVQVYDLNLLLILLFQLLNAQPALVDLNIGLFTMFFGQNAMVIFHHFHFEIFLQLNHSLGLLVVFALVVDQADVVFLCLVAGFF